MKRFLEIHFSPVKYVVAYILKDDLTWIRRIIKNPDEAMMPYNCIFVDRQSQIKSLRGGRKFGIHEFRFEEFIVPIFSWEVFIVLLPPLNLSPGSTFNGFGVDFNTTIKIDFGLLEQ